MPGTRCSVAVCNNSLNMKDPSATGLHIMYHTFPKTPEIRNIWIQRCRRADTFNPNSGRICSVHFENNDYERDLKAELLNIPQKKVLKKSAVPTKGLSSGSYFSTNLYPNARASRQDKRKNRQCVQELIEESQQPLLDNNVPTEQQETFTNEEFQEMKEKYKHLEKEYSNAQFQIRKLQETIKRCQTNLFTKDLSLKWLKQELQRAKRQGLSDNVILQKARNVLLQIFTENQVSILLRKKKKVNWTSEEMSVAFTLRYLSKRAYIYLRQKLHYPLPGLSTLQRWASALNLRQGLLSDVLRIMKIAAATMGSAEKLTVLQFDEVKVKKLYEYDLKADQVVGPHSQMQVVMARGLISKWKQPVYVDFDRKMTKDVLLTVIRALKDAGYLVVACVSDMGGGNQGLWRELGVNLNKTWFCDSSSTDNSKIYCFADAPHLLKLIRNWFIDTGFNLPNDRLVNICPLKSLIEIDNHEIKVCHSLTTANLECQGTQRQNVRLAAQLLSHSTASALQFFKPHSNSELTESTAEFIGLVNKWFDIMNSYVQDVPGYLSKSGYGTYLEEQNRVLDTMYNYILTMRCCGKTFLQIFQKAILISISSLRSLFIDVKREYGITYLLTHRLNQDSLENLFSQIRTRGGLDDHPTPMNALFRLRMIILGKNPGVVQKNTNTTERNDDEYFVANVFKKLGVLPDKIEEATDDMLSDLNGGTSETVPSVLKDINNNKPQAAASLFTETEENGLYYIAGWVAKKLRKVYPYLGDPTRVIRTEHSYTLPTWIQNLSFGGLIEPTQIWKDGAKELESAFCKRHGENSINKEAGVIRTLSDRLALEFPEIPTSVIYTFIKIRTFIRIKYLNCKAKELTSNTGKRKLSENISDEGRKKRKKMNKLTK